MKTNRIPRNFQRIRFTALVKTNAGEIGDTFWLHKKDSDGLYRVMNARTGKYYIANLGMIRTPELTRIEEIVA